MSTSAGRLDVALLGFGTVGRAVARQLSEGRYPSLCLRVVCTRRARLVQHDAAWVAPDVIWTERMDDVLATGASVVVELLGGVEPARALIVRALEAGRSVVTANKQVLAEHGPELVSLARRFGCALRFEGAVCGVIPVVRAVQEGLPGDRLTSAAGVVNGTTNFVLTRMERDGVSLDEAVAAAQARGFAEADPSADLDGLDARAKLVILTAIGLGHYLPPDDVPAESVRGIELRDLLHAASIGRAIRQVAWVERGPDARPVTARVAPVLVRRESWLARAEGPRNVLVVRGERSGETVFVGEGAGGDATAVAVVSDLLAVADAVTVPRAWPCAEATGRAEPAGTDAGRPASADVDVIAPHYVRVTARAGAPCRLPASLLARHGLRVQRVLSEGHGVSGHWAGVLDTCCQQAVSDALHQSASDGGAGYAAIRLPIIDVG